MSRATLAGDDLKVTPGMTSEGTAKIGRAIGPRRTTTAAGPASGRSPKPGEVPTAQQSDGGNSVSAPTTRGARPKIGSARMTMGAKMEIGGAPTTIGTRMNGGARKDRNGARMTGNGATTRGEDPPTPRCGEDGNPRPPDSRETTQAIEEAIVGDPRQWSFPHLMGLGISTISSLNMRF